jgi:hypothetical protein
MPRCTNVMAQAAAPASAVICGVDVSASNGGVDVYASNGCEESFGRQRPNALRVHFKGTPNWGLLSKIKRDLGFHYRVQLSLTADFPTVAATQIVVLNNEEDNDGGIRYEGVLFENLSAGNTYFLRVAAFSFFLGDWTTTTSGTMVLGAPGAPGISTSTGIFEGPYIEVCVRKGDLLKR